MEEKQIYMDYIQNNPKNAVGIIKAFRVLFEKMESYLLGEIPAIPMNAWKGVLQELLFMNRDCYRKTGKKFLTATVSYDNFNIEIIYNAAVLVFEVLDMKKPVSRICGEWK